MIEVELPDGRIIEFPDGTPPEEMQRVAREAVGQAQAQPDFTAQLQAATGTVSAPMEKAPMVSRDPFRETSTPYQLAADIRGGAARGVSALAGLPQLAMQTFETQGIPPFGIKGPPVSQYLASAGDIERGLEQTLGPSFGVRKEPTGAAGRLAGGVYEFLGAGAGPRVATLAGGGASAAGEGTRLIAGDRPGDPGLEYEPYARLAGGLIGSLGTAGLAGKERAVSREIRETTRGISPRKFRAAAALEARSRAQGIPLTGPEALSPSATHPLSRTAQYVATSPHGTQLANALTGRPGMIRRALQNAARQMAPGQAGEPSAIAARAAGAAESRLQRATRARTRRTSQFFEKAAEGEIRASDAQGVIRRIDRQLRDTAPGTAVHRELTRLRDMLGESRRIGPLQDFYKNLREVRFKDRPGATDTISKTEQAQLRPVLARLQASFGRGSQDYRAGRRNYRELSRRLVDPLVRGPVKQMAEAGGKTQKAYTPEADASINKVIRQMRDPNEIGPKGIAELSRNMNRQDPRAFPELARRWIEDTAKKSGEKIQGAPINPQIGTNFYKAVFGETPKANTNAVLRGVAQAHGVNANAYVRGWRNFMKVIERTGRIPQAGSPTESLTSTGVRVGTGGLQEWRNRILQFKFNVGKGRVQELARIFTQEGSVNEMLRLSRLKPESRQAQALVGAFIAPLLTKSATERQPKTPGQ